MKQQLYSFFFLLIAAIPAFAQTSAPTPTGKESLVKESLVIVYFSPADCTPVADRAQRLGRVMTHVQDFYRKGMDANGFGAISFDLEWSEPGTLKLHEIRGRQNQSEYGRDDAYKVRQEVYETLKAEGIEPDRRFVVIFQQGLKWENGKATEIGPYVGGGWNYSGTAWVFDDPLLDPDRLSDNSAGGYYYGPCSIGQFNSHYMGGVAHEMGHMFGLPHDCQTNEQYTRLGRSLMGAGNHTYGESLRSEGSGTFLSLAEAIRLSRNAAFVGTRPVPPRSACEFVQLKASYNDKNQIVLSGQIKTDLPAYGIVAYVDANQPKSDYDAFTGVASVDSQGSFEITVTEWPKTDSEIRLAVLLDNGAVAMKTIPCVLTGLDSDFENW